MSTAPGDPALSTAGLSVVQFEIRDGSRRVSCVISEEALEAVSGLSLPSTHATRRRSFDRFRTLIDAAAKMKIRTLSEGFMQPLSINSSDLRLVPHEAGVPTYGSAPRGT